MSSMRFIHRNIANATRRMDVTCKVCVQELRISGGRRPRGGARSGALEALEGSGVKILEGLLRFLIRKPPVGTPMPWKMRLRRVLHGADRFQ